MRTVPKSKFRSFSICTVIVLTATEQHGNQKRELLWRQWQQEMTQLSPLGKQIFAWNSGHYIQMQQPELVIDAVYTVIQSANSNKEKT